MQSLIKKFPDEEILNTFSLVIVRPIDDTFLTFNESKVVILNNTDFEELKNVFSSDFSGLQIIDFRLGLLIMFGIYTFGDLIFVYDLRQMKIINIYSYIIEHFNLSESDVLELRTCKIIANIILVRDFYFKALNLRLYISPILLSIINNADYNIFKLIFLSLKEEIVENEELTESLALNELIMHKIRKRVEIKTFKPFTKNLRVLYFKNLLRLLF
jgi:hypothetical protein